MALKTIDQMLDDFDKWRKQHPEYGTSLELLRSIADESPRGMVLVVAAELERILLLAIKGLLRSGKGLENLDKDKQGPISTLSAKINLSHALGIIDDVELRDLHLIRQIRNDFAHSTSVSFLTAAVVSRVNELSQSTPAYQPVENLENNAVHLVMIIGAAALGAEKTELPRIERVFGPEQGMVDG